jgi:hypothetical protein
MTTMTVKEVLESGLKNIEKIKNWTQQSYARNEQGRMVLILDQSACSYCSIGAILKVAGYNDMTSMVGEADEGNPLAKITVDAVKVIRGEVVARMGLRMSGSIEEFNDDHPHEEVVKIFKQAISKL